MWPMFSSRFVFQAVALYKCLFSEWHVPDVLIWIVTAKERRSLCCWFDGGIAERLGSPGHRPRGVDGHHSKQVRIWSVRKV